MDLGGAAYDSGMKQRPFSSSFRRAQTGAGPAASLTECVFLRFLRCDLDALWTGDVTSWMEARGLTFLSEACTLAWRLWGLFFRVSKRRMLDAASCCLVSEALGPQAAPPPRSDLRLKRFFEDRVGEEVAVGEGCSEKSLTKPETLLKRRVEHFAAESLSGSKCGRQALKWHSLQHYKHRLLLSIHSILRLKSSEELREPLRAAALVRDVG